MDEPSGSSSVAFNREKPHLDAPSRVASTCIARTLGVDVEFWDVGGRQGAHDLKFKRGGRTVAVESKLVVDPIQRQAEAESGRIGYTQDPRLFRSWRLSLEHRARFRQAQKQVGDLLVLAETLEWPGGPIDRFPRQGPSPLGELRALGVTFASQVAPTQMHPPGFYLMPNGWGDMVPDLDSLPGFVSTLLRSKQMGKLRRQLRDARADERHAFLFIGWEFMKAIHLTHDGSALPTAAPELPEQVDGVWLAATTSESPVIAWLPTEGWINAARILSDD